MNSLNMVLEEKQRRAIMESSESKVIRIVNLPKDTKNYELTDFLKEQMNLQGKIEDIHIRNDYKLGLVFAYVIFEFSCDARTAAEMLNCDFYKSMKLDVAQIAPNGNYRKYLVGSILNIKNYIDVRKALMERRLQHHDADL